jgi:hypothetical protein
MWMFNCESFCILEKSCPQLSPLIMLTDLYLLNIRKPDALANIETGRFWFFSLGGF